MMGTERRWEEEHEEPTCGYTRNCAVFEGWGAEPRDAVGM